MHRIASLCVVLALMAGPARAQNEQAAPSGPPATLPTPSGPPTTLQTPDAKSTAAAVERTQQIKNETQSMRNAVGPRSNIKVEISISDQRGDGPAEKKQVSMIVAETSWGKIRTHADARPSSPGPPMTVALNVDARPFLTTTGQIQLELVVNYNPLDETGKAGIIRPTELNQSMTVVLQSGKPLIVAQAADPIVDRKMIVEVVATILK